MTEVEERDADVWIFGYGSLVHRPGFAFEQRAIGYVSGYARRFWQESLDHRGTPERPGRVVTLVSDPTALCWGAAYRVARASAAEVLAQLELREKCGYRSVELPFFGAGDDGASCGRPPPLVATSFVGTADNPHFTGPEDEETLAQIIRDAWGPSGRNVDYVLDLHDALLALGISDPHVARLADLLR